MFNFLSQIKLYIEKSFTLRTMIEGVIQLNQVSSKQIYEHRQII